MCANNIDWLDFAILNNFAQPYNLPTYASNNILSIPNSKYFFAKQLNVETLWIQQINLNRYFQFSLTSKELNLSFILLPATEINQINKTKFDIDVLFKSDLSLDIVTSGTFLNTIALTYTGTEQLPGIPYTNEKGTFYGSQYQLTVETYNQVFKGKTTQPIEGNTFAFAQVPVNNESSFLIENELSTGNIIVMVNLYGYFIDKTYIEKICSMNQF